MKLKGKYIHEITKFVDCELLIENGLIHKTVVDLPPIYAFSYPPKNKSDFKLEKLGSEKGIIPKESNYLIEYIGKSDSIQKMYFNLNSIQLFKLKWQLKRFLIQDKSLKLGILKYLVISIIGFLGFLIGRYYENNIKTMETPETAPNKEIQKSLEENASDKKFKKDSIIIK